MIERYTRPKMGAIWTEENKYKAWLEVEILACEAWAEIGDIPKEDVAKIRAGASFNVDRILEIEQETRHNVATHTRAVNVEAFNSWSACKINALSNASISIAAGSSPFSIYKKFAA